MTEVRHIQENHSERVDGHPKGGIDCSKSTYNRVLIGQLGA